MHPHTRRLIPLVLCAFVLAPAVPVRPASAALVIKITQGIEGAQPIAIVPFGWSGSAASPPQRIGEIVADDLVRTGRLEPIPFPDLPSRPTEAAEVNFGDWRILGAPNLVVGRITERGDGRYTIEFRLFDVFRAKQLTGFQVDTSSADLRRVAHQISDIIYERLTGERGAFDTRVAYVTETTVTGPRDKRYALNVADSDGYNASTILESREPILSPAWAPDGRRIAYVSYERDRPRVFVQDLASGERRELAGFPGTNGAPAWSPDGTKIAVSLSKDGNSEIYVMDVDGSQLRRLTSNGAIDTEPAWAPDGESIVFTSDRGGRPQIYRIPSTGGRAERVTFEGNYNARASFSPDGTKLAFVHAVEGRFRIAVLDLQSGALQVLTRTSLDESPTFAPNGGMILYATVDDGVSALAAVSTDGRMRQQLAVQQGKVREPAWSPFRKP